MRILFWLICPLLLAGCATAAVTPSPPASPSPEASHPLASPIPANKYDQYEIITLLPRDAIPAIDNPRFLDAATADSEYAPDELVMGVVFNGEARAYSVPHLSSHEIVNDTVGGVKIAVTW
jgi:hypothetical protein